ncbi:MAG: radical SAM family heme chaperone HemW [Firmicutes bacterium]|nr:radical SAM family heme chaperone HemW [Bacillota bacterium]
MYLHIPFCARKCNYCDFVSFPGQSGDVIGAYTGRLCEDIASAGERYADRYCVDTVFIGGGTPSLLDPQQLERILRAIDEHFRCDIAELTLESNPGTFGEEKLRAYAGLGVNRLSMGVQSLDDAVLKRLGRIHDSETALKAMRAAKKLGINFNVDLMLGVPGQSLAVWEDTLKRTVGEGPSHISFYSLQLEMGTPFYRDFKDGKLELPEWSENRAMYHRALEILKEAGYRHYEISNAALPGCECRHNLKYWTMQDYLGLGMAAHSYIGGRRCFTTSDLEEYLAGPAEPEWEETDGTSRKTDFVFTELRLIEGFRKQTYREMFGSAFEEDFAPAYQELLQEGLLEETDGRIRLTSAGLDKTNPVMEALLNV